MAVAIRDAVELLMDARSNHRLVAPLTETYGDFTLGEAYAIQDELRAEFIRRGETPTGWKLAATASGRPSNHRCNRAGRRLSLFPKIRERGDHFRRGFH